MKAYNETQKFRVIVEGVSLYSTAKDIRKGIGDSRIVNNATQECLMALEKMRVDGARGLAGRWKGLNVQIDAI